MKSRPRRIVLLRSLASFLLSACTASNEIGDDNDAGGGRRNTPTNESSAPLSGDAGDVSPDFGDASAATSSSSDLSHDAGSDPFDAATLTTEGSVDADIPNLSSAADATDDAGNAINSDSTHLSDSSDNPVPTVIGVDAGFSHDCRLFSNGQVECRGDGRRGQLGAVALGRTTDDWVGMEDLAGPAVAIAVGLQHSCAVLDDGTVQCWGYNNEGQLGNGTTTASEVPSRVVDLEGVVAVAAGGDATCALLEIGELRCWGSNHGGQLGNGSTSSPVEAPAPLPVVGIEDAVKVRVGTHSACALRADGRVLCWGNGDDGRLGNGEAVSSGVPTLVTSIEGAVDVSVGSSSNGVYDSACAVVGDGSVWCWGNNTYGQLGEGSARDSSATPVQIEGAPIATRVSVGSNHVCVIAEDSGSVWCWGDNSSGQLGTGNTTSLTIPEQTIAAQNDVTELVAGTEHTCAVRRGDSVCWGR